jgi:hypothetical protein
VASEPSVPAVGAATPDGRPAPKPPPRPAAEIERDIDAERKGLVDAVSSLRAEASETRAKLLSPRVLAIGASALAALVVFRRRRRRRKRARG